MSACVFLCLFICFPADENWLRVRFGDIVELSNDGHSYLDNGDEWLQVTCLRNGESGDLPSGCLSLLPILAEPDTKEQVLAGVESCEVFLASQDK